jgi:UDP-N-acetylmuramoylalanine--D-glutamate ligase
MIDMLDKKKVLVVGLGKSGIAMMNVLFERGFVVDVYDGKEKDQVQEIEWIKSHSHQQFFSRIPEQLEYDFIAISPGVPTNLEWLDRANKQGAEILGEIEWAYRFAKGDFFGITGTNGKTTTTQLTYEIFREHFDNVELVGNIGIPAVEKADEAPEGTHFIAEISSFQLETIKKFKVRVGAVLNLTPDHLNRHGTMEKYIEAKYRIFENMDEDGYRVLNYNDPILQAYGKTFSNTFFFSRCDSLDRGCFVNHDIIQISDEKIYQVMPKGDIGIPGEHNVENILAAISIAYLAGIPIDTIARVVKAFKGVEHRLEIFEEKMGRVFINDSKATNPDATIKAIESMSAPTVLLAGGMDKGSDFTEMIRRFKPHIRHMVVYGETKMILEETAVREGFEEITVVDNLDQAVTKAMSLSGGGYTILLSPACASWDMYPNFEVRGRHFKEIVEKLG